MMTFINAIENIEERMLIDLNDQNFTGSVFKLEIPLAQFSLPLVVGKVWVWENLSLIFSRIEKNVIITHLAMAL